jgi:enediyne biosynthesis protein E4
MRLSALLSLVVISIAAYGGAHQTAKPANEPAPIPGKFTDVASSLSVRFKYMSSHTAKHYLPETMGGGVALFDYDNDGWKDLFIAQGHDLDTIELNYPNLRYREAMLLLRNAGKQFVDVSADSGAVFHEPWLGRGMAIGDIDNDGRIDAVIPTNDGPAHILRNETPRQNHWLALKLAGHKSNRDAIGAEVKVVTSAGPQFATVTTSSSYWSASDKRVHFGLGADSAAQSIEIRWPSGIRQTLKNVRCDQIVQVDEPSAGSAGGN